MKRSFGILFMFVVVSAKAQVKVSGKITDTKGKPVRGASITLKNSYDGATTDSLGHYSFLTGPKTLA